MVTSTDYAAAATLFRALASPVRIAIVDQLLDGGRCVHELVTALALPQPLISQHLRTMREADLVVRVRRGREVAYVLADEHISHIVHDALHHTGATPVSESTENTEHTAHTARTERPELTEGRSA